MRGPSLFVIGWGRVGSALGTQARAAGLPLVGVETRDARRRAAAKRLIGKGGGKRSGGIGEADLVAVTVPDGALADVVRGLAPRLRSGQVVFHCAGSLDLIPLEPARAAGCQVGSLHPYCSVAAAESPLQGMACAIDGTPRAKAALRAFTRALGLRPFRVAPGDRVAYHLSAVLNVTTANVAALSGERLLATVGIGATEARRALAAILRSVAFNLEHAPGSPLTGPFVRGDVTRIGLQLKKLSGDPQALAIYAAAGRVTTALTRGLTEVQRQAVYAVLDALPSGE